MNCAIASAQYARSLIIQANEFDWLPFWGSAYLTRQATGRFVKTGGLWYAEIVVLSHCLLVETRQALAYQIVPPEWVNADGTPTVTTTIEYLDAIGNVNDASGGFKVKDGIVVEAARTVGKAGGEIVAGVTEASGAGLASGIAAIFKTSPLVGILGVAAVGTVVYVVIRKWKG